MINLNDMIKQQIVSCFGRGEFENLFSALVGDVNKLFIVHGHKSYQACGAKDLVNDVTRGMQVVEFDDFTENPKKEDVVVGVTFLKQVRPDLIVAIGGGSVMDMAKLIRFYAQHRVPLLAIPTTAGTGAESTQFAVCYINGVKHSINDSSILPDRVILYPPLTYNNNRYLTSCTGFDALAQAIESYWNINATTESDKYAFRAIEKIYSVLIKNELSAEDRAVLIRGANDAGRAINITRTTVPHALSYTLTSKYGYPHGHAVALSFPFFLKYNLDGSADSFRGNDYKHYMAKMNQLRSILNVGDDPFAVMKEFICHLGLGFDPKRDFDDQVVACGLNLERAGNTPIAIDKDVIISAVQSIRN